MALWSPDKFQHAKSVHVLPDQSIVVEMADVVIELAHVTVACGKFSTQIKTHSRFLERIVLAAADPGGRRPRD